MPQCAPPSTIKPIIKGKKEKFLQDSLKSRQNKKKNDVIHNDFMHIIYINQLKCI
jgi:hypothetical protein